jgi:hypothetical protein
MCVQAAIAACACAQETIPATPYAPIPGVDGAPAFVGPECTVPYAGCTTPSPYAACTTPATYVGWDGTTGLTDYGTGYAAGTCPDQAGDGAAESGSRCGRCCRYAHLHSTFDLYPHYAYPPEHHGYYYYRPYNYVHVLEHQSSVVRLGGDPKNPYSVRMFDAIERDFELRYPQIVEPEAALRLDERLPLLEDLLR